MATFDGLDQEQWDYLVDVLINDPASPYYGRPITRNTDLDPGYIMSRYASGDINADLLTSYFEIVDPNGNIFDGLLNQFGLADRYAEETASEEEENGLDDTTDEGDPFGAYAIDTDGDGFVDTVQGTNPYGETVLVQGNDSLNDEIQAAQDLKDSIYNQEGWDDLEDWEQDQQLINAGGSAINGTDGTEPEEEQDTSLTDKAKESIGKLKDAFPTLEDLIAKLPKDPKEWVDAIGTVLETAGVDLPNGDIDAILQGGYGVEWDPANSVFKDVLSGEVFVPGIPAGGTPSSVTIGTLEDLLKYPKETIQQRVEEIWGEISGDPVDFIKGIIASGADLPDNFFDILAGIATAGSGFIEWAKNAAAEAGTKVPPVVGGPDNKEEEAAEDALTFGGLPGTGTFDSQDVEKSSDLVIPGGVTETTTNNGMLTGTNENLTFGGESGNGITEQDINGLYLSLLNRDAKQAGLDYWMGDVERGATLDDIEFNIKQSEEYKNLNANNGSGDLTFGHNGKPVDSTVTGSTNVLDLSGDVGNNEEDKTKVVEELLTNGKEEDKTKVVEEILTNGKEEDKTPVVITGDRVVPPEIVEPRPQIFDEPDPEPEVLITEDPVGGGSSSGGSGSSDPFVKGVTYVLPTPQEIMQSRAVNFMEPLDAIINKGAQSSGMFSEMIG